MRSHISNISQDLVNETWLMSFQIYTTDFLLQNINKTFILGQLDNPVSEFNPKTRSVLFVNKSDCFSEVNEYK